MDHIAYSINEKKVTVRLPEQMDIQNSGEIRKEVSKLVQEKKDMDFHFELSRVQYLDSVGVGVLVGFQRKIYGNGNDVVFLNPGDQVMRIFETTQLIKVFNIKHTEAF